MSLHYAIDANNTCSISSKVELIFRNINKNLQKNKLLYCYFHMYFTVGKIVREIKGNQNFNSNQRNTTIMTRQGNFFFKVKRTVKLHGKKKADTLELLCFTVLVLLHETKTVRIQ